MFILLILYFIIKSIKILLLVAAIICPHLSWRWMFFLFGSFGFIWVLVWVFSFKEIRIAVEDDDFIIVPPKVLN